MVERVSNFLCELARRAPALYTSVEPEVIQLYVERRGDGCLALTQAGEAKRRLPEAMTVLGAVSQQFANTAATTLPSYQVLTRVLAEQCDVIVDQAGHPTVQIKAPTAIPCDSVEHPADPESSYNAHRGQGYLVQIMETYAEDDAVADPVSNDPPLPDLINITA
jgi:hypothetical protein